MDEIVDKQIKIWPNDPLHQLIDKHHCLHLSLKLDIDLLNGNCISNIKDGMIVLRYSIGSSHHL